MLGCANVLAQACGSDAELQCVGVCVLMGGDVW